MDYNTNNLGLFQQQMNNNQIISVPNKMNTLFGMNKMNNQNMNVPNKLNTLFGMNNMNSNQNMIIPIKKFSNTKNPIKIMGNPEIMNQLYKNHNMKSMYFSRGQKQTSIQNNTEILPKKSIQNNTENHSKKTIQINTEKQTKLQYLVDKFAKPNKNDILTINIFKINVNDLKNDQFKKDTPNINKTIVIDKININNYETNENFNNFCNSIYKIEKRILLKDRIISEINEIGVSYENGEENSSIKRISSEQSFDSDSISFIIGEEAVNDLNYDYIYENKEDFSLDDEDILNLD